MKRTLIGIALVLICLPSAWASHPQTVLAQQVGDQASGAIASTPQALFKQHIPFIAEKFIGMPVKMGGNPDSTGTTDNSSLFYSIYTAAAQKSGLRYKAYLPIKYLLANTDPISGTAVENGDLIVLKNGLAAMVYKIEPTGRMHMIYASEKRSQVFSFHTDNPVFQAYWLEHLKGFFRLKPEMLILNR